MAIAELTGQAARIWEVDCHIQIKGYWHSHSQIDLGSYVIHYTRNSIYIAKVSKPFGLREFDAYEEILKENLSVGEAEEVTDPEGKLLVTVKRLK